MLPEERRQQILRVVMSKKSATVDALAMMLGISANTVRRDLNALARQNLLVRTHGGAVANYVSTGILDSNYMERSQQFIEEKQRIGSAAVRLINDGETVILDYGSTALQIAKQMRQLKKCTVLTSSLPVAVELLNAPQILVYLSGGIINHSTYGLIGPDAESFYDGVNADKGFISVARVDIEHGLMSSNWFEVNVKRKMMERCREVILLLPHYRLDTRGMVGFGQLSAVHKVITDKLLPPSYQEFFDRLGVQVIVAT
ncbi:MAG: DeoR/GlpR family DNA-binding transcription regulator [Bacillota bacterium]|nr:DeoR/GlpR family DNA-binding transcription regulator [Bacillota bacterium]